MKGVLHQPVYVTVVRDEAVYGHLAGHRGWVRERDVLPLDKGGSFDTLRLQPLISVDS